MGRPSFVPLDSVVGVEEVEEEEEGEEGTTPVAIIRMDPSNDGAYTFGLPGKLLNLGGWNRT
jgi:hypothetical protein